MISTSTTKAGHIVVIERLVLCTSKYKNQFLDLHLTNKPKTINPTPYAPIHDIFYQIELPASSILPHNKITLWIQSIVYGNAIFVFVPNTKIAYAIQRPSRNPFPNAFLVLFPTPNVHALSSVPL